MAASTVTLHYVVGNTYERIAPLKAKFDRSRKHRKVHDWTLFVDVVQGNPDAIERVAFDLGPSFVPQVFVCSSPVPVKRPNGSRAWRFSTRQQTYAEITAKLTLRGAGGTVLPVQHKVVLDEEAARRKPPVHTFRETRSLAPFKMLKLPDTRSFGVELELTSARHIQLQEVADRMSESIGRGVKVTSSYRAGRATSDTWKLVPDSSIVCNNSQPDCNTFEVVSPVLHGGSGLQELNFAMKVLASIRPGLTVNKSMGFHVHIDVSGLSVPQLIKVCQNFIKYEEVMDQFMPLSRRDDSPECERYFQSNRRSVDGETNRQRHSALASCSDVGALAHEMNRSGRYYKLNLQNLVTDRQPTIEFRQHSATVNYSKVSAWVRFCMTFVIQSSRLKEPSPFAEDRTISEKFEALFLYVIKDRGLRDFYQKRRAELAADGDVCCEACRAGGSCTAA